MKVLMTRRLFHTMMGLCVAESTHGCSGVLSKKRWEVRRRVSKEGNDQASTPGSSWAGMGVTIRFPGKSPDLPPLNQASDEVRLAG